MNVVHAFCILATLWFAVLMSAQAVLVFVFWHTEQLAEGSHLVESTGEVRTLLATTVKLFWGGLKRTDTGHYWGN